MLFPGVCVCHAPIILNLFIFDFKIVYDSSSLLFFHSKLQVYCTDASWCLEIFARTICID